MEGQRLIFSSGICPASVDIDLTYTEISDRKSSFEDIIKSLNQIKARLNEIKPDIVTVIQEENLKLLLSHKHAQLKIEVNQIKRGCIAGVETKVLCNKAQEVFKSFCEINVVPFSQLFGGKIIALVPIICKSSSICIHKRQRPFTLT